MGDHARMLRKLTEMPGGPCVLVLCHPIKHVTEPAQLLPRGGGAFLAEMDGNLTAWRRDDLVELHHNKIRGPGFEPMTFRIEQITTTELMDSKGRLIPTVKLVLVSEHEEAAQKQKTRNEEDQLLAAVAEIPISSMAQLARACGWLWQNGEPAKSKVERVLKRLKAEKLVKYSRGRWVLDARWEKKLRKGSNVDAGSDAFQPVKGKRVQGTECVHCGNAYGEVFKIRNGRVKKGRGEALHEACAEAWFSGDFCKKGAGRLKRDFFGNRPIFAKQDRTAGQLVSEQTRNPCFTGRPSRTASPPCTPILWGCMGGFARAVPSWLTPYKETIRTLQRQGVAYGARPHRRWPQVGGGLMMRAQLISTAHIIGDGVKAWLRATRQSHLPQVAAKAARHRPTAGAPSRRGRSPNQRRGRRRSA